MVFNRQHCYNDSNLFKVEIEDETFDYVEGIKLNESKCRKCRYRKTCDKNFIIRRFECKRYLTILQSFYYLITNIIVACISGYIFRNLELSLFKKTAVLLVALVILDILCSFIEGIVPQIYDKLFYEKLKRIKSKKEKLEEANRRAEEEKRQKEEEEKRTNIPNYRKIEVAQKVVKAIHELANKYDFGPNEEKINICVQKSEEILQQVQEDYSGESYKRVVLLFEAYLPEFYDTLEFYSDFIKANAVTQENENILTQCVDILLKYLEKQKVRAVLDKETVETRFQATTDTLKKALKEELNK